jgi:hypothetical protein
VIPTGHSIWSTIKEKECGFYATLLFPLPIEYVESNTFNSAFVSTLPGSQLFKLTLGLSSLLDTPTRSGQASLKMLYSIRDKLIESLSFGCHFPIFNGHMVSLGRNVLTIKEKGYMPCQDSS